MANHPYPLADKIKEEKQIAHRPITLKSCRVRSPVLQKAAAIID